MLTKDSTIRNVDLKFYAEQCKHFSQEYYDTLSDEKEKYQYQVEILKEILLKVKRLPIDTFLAFGIIHSLETKGDSFWYPATEKPHVHIDIILLNGYTRKVRTIFSLLDIVYRDDDEAMWKHGIARIKDKNAVALYLTHDTIQARRDGKRRYPFISVYTNNEDSYRELRGDGESAQVIVQKGDWARLDREAYELGYALGDWGEWYESQPRSAKEQLNKIRVCREQYDKGISKRIEENPYITKLAVYIQGAPNSGKSTAVKYALSDKRNLDISGGGTGQFDRLTPIYSAIYINDGRVPSDSLYSLADDQMANVYHRNRNNSYFCGDTLIVTSNTSFEDWIISCGIKAKEKILDVSCGYEDYRYTTEYNAIKSRFFVCYIDESRRLQCIEPCTRGTDTVREKRCEMYKAFRRKFNEKILSYTPAISEIDMFDLNYN